MLFFSSPKHTCQDLALLLLRVTVGSIFIAHGAQKLFGLFGGPGLAGFIDWMGQYGLPAWLAILAAVAEFVGGVLMFVGIAPELGALMTIPVMVGAIVVVHWGHGYFIQNGGFEYPLNLILLACAVILGGGGKWVVWDPVKALRARH